MIRLIRNGWIQFTGGEQFMNGKIVNFAALALVIAAMMINNLEALHTFKTIFNSVAMAVLGLIGFIYTKRNKRPI